MPRAKSLSMRTSYRLQLAVFFALAAAATSSPLFAFHDGGVGSCSSCHLMTRSSLGAPIVAGGGASLIAATASDVCLTCHAENYGAVLGDDPLAPPPERGAGNFVFLLEDNLNDGIDGGTLPIPGDAAGHNLVAPGYGLQADPTWQSSPGGSYPVGSLGCTSCHDPHGSKEFRFLRGSGPIDGGNFTFLFPAPQAEGLDPSTQIESNDRHTAYHAGLSDWCANCHGPYHDEGLPDFEHPSDENLGGEIQRRYNEYAGDDHPDEGFPGTAYLAAVPFEDPSAATDSRQGPIGSSRVMCLTCHRAHASSAPRAGRWDFNLQLLQDDGLASGSWPIPDPYSSPNQGTLCSKCHADLENPDASDNGLGFEIPNTNDPN